MGGSQGPRAGAADERAGATEDAGTAVNLGVLAATSALGLTLGAVDGSLNLDVVLSAAEHEGQVKTLSHPRVTTQNNVQATIVQGDQIPIQTVANNTVTVQFKDAALRLAVTPQITAADTVILQLEIDNDFVNYGESVNGVPPIVTQRAVTTVQVADGDTTVIGGIYQRGSQRRTAGLRDTLRPVGHHRSGRPRRLRVHRTAGVDESGRTVGSRNLGGHPRDAPDGRSCECAGTLGGDPARAAGPRHPRVPCRGGIHLRARADLRPRRDAVPCAVL